MDPLHLCIFLVPLAVYLLLMGMIHFSRRPFVTTGARDTASLAVAVIGFAIAGPMKLFVPQSAVNSFGPFVWLMMIALYLLGLTLLVLCQRPRLIIYNSTTDQLRSVLKAIAADLDPTAHWAADSLNMPSLRVHLFIEPSLGHRCCQLVSAGPYQRFAGWRRLETELTRAMKSQDANRGMYGVMLMALAVFTLSAISLSMFADPLSVAIQMNQLLRP